MPVPQENLLFVERASCPFLRIVQDVRRKLKKYPRKSGFSIPSIVIVIAVGFRKANYQLPLPY